MDKLIETALNELDAYLKKTDWYGRENEVVNLFAHAFLAKHLDISRIGIEVSVRQLSGTNGKALVRKDLVIWERGGGTVWNGKREPVNVPSAVIEWKVDSAGDVGKAASVVQAAKCAGNAGKCEDGAAHVAKCAGDIEWLKGFTAEYPGVAGYSVCAFIKGARGVKWVRIRKGEVVGTGARC